MFSFIVEVVTGIWKFVVLSYWIDIGVGVRMIECFIFAELKSESTEKANAKVGFW